MLEQRSRPASRRPRPVAELALEPLLERTRELARRWAIALILDGPLESLGAVPLEDLAREAPELIGALLGAVSSEEELEQLLARSPTGSPGPRIPTMSGATDAAGVVAAVEELRGVLSDALMDHLEGGAGVGPGVRQLTDLADRLAHVCAAIIPSALEGIEAAGPPSRSAPGPVTPPVGSPGRRPVGAGFAIIDELAPPEPAEPSPAPAGLREEADAVGEPSASAEIQVRDERGDEGPAAWIRSIGRQLERFEEDGISFAVLLLEARGLGRETSGEAFEQLLGEAIPAGASVTRERAGRHWLVVPAIDRLGAGNLAGELTAALESGIGRGLPGFAVLVGTAVCPEDGRRASTLAAHADVGLYAARADRSLAGDPRGDWGA